MITEKNGIIHLETDNLSYVMRVGKFGHIEQLYFGKRIDVIDERSLELTHDLGMGSTVAYDESDGNYCLDNILLEYSGIGKGDYRNSPLEAKMPDGTFVSDFVFESLSVEDGVPKDKELPFCYDGEGNVKTLTIKLKDKKMDMYLSLYYAVFEKSNCIVRWAKIQNNEKNPLVLRKFMSAMLDFMQEDYDLITLDGGWAKEAHEHRRPLAPGIYVNDSKVGASSNRHNAGFLICQRTADDERGTVMGFNLIYSGNHYGAAEVCNHGTMRVMLGVNPYCFEWELKTGEEFVTPQAVLTKSYEGFNGISKNFHSFAQNDVIRGEHKTKERPVLANHWEGFFFDFNKRKIVSLARRAAKLGIELFVLDDGWFGNRNSDTAGLGDYNVNRKKLPGGLKSLSKKLNAMGLKFGLWFEPECVNIDSDLYRAHPDWAVQIEGRTPSMGRHQLVLDLTNEKVRDYIVTNVNNIIASSNVEYVKWDYNRHISDACSPTLSNQGRFFHLQTLGLYDVLRRITEANPTVLFESCSSGGNRFDLGMLCFTPQIWVSDDTDPIERLAIQGGLLRLYPQSTMGAHVSSSPSQQTLRKTRLSTRFNVAAFGAFGYEMDFKELNRAEKKEIKMQIAFYKKHRRTFQFGQYSRQRTARANREVWQFSTENESVVADYQTQACASPPYDTLKLLNADDNAVYNVESVFQTLDIREFGGLVKHVLPIKVHADGIVVQTAAKFYRLPDTTEQYRVNGAQLADGIKINQQFMGSWFDERTRVLSDFGSRLYVFEKTA